MKYEKQAMAILYNSVPELAEGKSDTQHYNHIYYAPQLNHWLKLLYADAEIAITENTLRLTFYKEDLTLKVKKVDFNLTTGQPATEKDYRAIVEICT